MRGAFVSKVVKNLSVSQTVFFFIESQFIENDFGHSTILLFLVIGTVNGHGGNSIADALNVEYTISKVQC